MSQHRDRDEQAMRDYLAGRGEDLYRQRFQALVESRGRGLDGYSPLADLVGAMPYRPLPEATEPWIDVQTRAQLEALAASTNTAALLVWQGDGLQYTYDADGDREQMVISRSLAKPLSVIAVGRALHTGSIRSLDQPLGDYFVEWAGSPRGEITIAQLLQMRSGLVAQGFVMDEESIMNRAYLHPYHEQVILAEYPLEHPPGSRYDYSNANGELVATLIRRATGIPYAEWVGTEVLQPLGAAGGKVWMNREGGTAHSGCCALLPAESWLRLSLLLLQDGSWQGEQLLPPSFVTTMKEAAPDFPHAGMGIYLAGVFTASRGHMNPDLGFEGQFHSEPYLSADLFLFDGNGNQVAYHIPEHDMIIMRLGSSPPKEQRWDNAFLPNLLLRAWAQDSGAALIAQPRPADETAASAPG